MDLIVANSKMGNQLIRRLSDSRMNIQCANQNTPKLYPTPNTKFTCYYETSVVFKKINKFPRDNMTALHDLTCTPLIFIRYINIFYVSTNSHARVSEKKTPP